MRLVVAEKPSVARDLARIIGASKREDGYLEGSGVRVTWCVGHLAELEDPAHYDAKWKAWSFDTLPMLPTKFDLRQRQGDDGDSRLEVVFEEDPQGTKITLVHSDLPEGSGGEYEQGWSDHYIEPMRAYFRG